MLRDMGEKVPAPDRLAIETSVTDVKSAIEKNDPVAIKGALERLTAAQHKLAESLYQQAGSAGGPGPDAGPDPNATAGGGAPKDDVIDAEVVDEGQKSEVVSGPFWLMSVELPWTSRTDGGAGRGRCIKRVSPPGQRITRHQSGNRAAAVRFRASRCMRSADPERRRQWPAWPDGDGARGSEPFGFEGSTSLWSRRAGRRHRFGDLFADVIAVHGRRRRCRRRRSHASVP
jgi:molecular chaperone DnaK